MRAKKLEIDATAVHLKNIFYFLFVGKAMGRVSKCHVHLRLHRKVDRILR